MPRRRLKNSAPSLFEKKLPVKYQAKNIYSKNILPQRPCAPAGSLSPHHEAVVKRPFYIIIRFDFLDVSFLFLSETTLNLSRGAAWRRPRPSWGHPAGGGRPAKENNVFLVGNKIIPFQLITRCVWSLATISAAERYASLTKEGVVGYRAALGLDGRAEEKRGNQLGT